MKKILSVAAIGAAVIFGLTSCNKTNTSPESPFDTEEEISPGTEGEGFEADIDTTIYSWDGEKADDASADVAGSDEDFYYEANDFSNTVNVVFDGSSATVTSSSKKVLYDVQGGYVTIDMLTNTVKNVDIIVSGSSSDGGLKVYGEKKFKLTLAGVSLTSTRGPAINIQCKKRAFVHLQDGTTNSIQDVASYSDDTYYLNGATSSDEDRKGCFFSEGNLIFSGTGVLEVAGKYKHGIATDGYFYMRPGVTIVVNEAAKNALHVKGDSDDGIGVKIEGGLLYANVSSTAGKSIKTDLNVDITGGKFLLNTSGGSEYDADENDTSSPSCIKADGNISVSGGTLTLKSTGEGGKGISADGDFSVTGGTISVITSGGKYVYNEAADLTSSPKGIKIDGNITIDGGNITIYTVGKNEGAEGLESKSALTINDGEVYVYAYDDAINGKADVTINGGKVFCYSVDNDGIDSNGTLNVTGGVVVSSGTKAPEEGFDCDSSDKFIVSGGILVGTGGTASSPSSSSTQRTILYHNLSYSKGTLFCIRNSAGTPVLIYSLPRTMSGMSLFFSSPDITTGTYTSLKGGTTSGGSSWNGLYSDATWSGGTELKSFNVNSTVTTVGTTTGGGNQQGGGGAGGRR